MAHTHTPAPCILDSDAWLAYLGGEVEELRDIVDAGTPHITDLAMAEIVSKCVDAGRDCDDLVAFLRYNAVAVPVTPELAVLAASVQDAGSTLTDRLAIAVALELSLPLITVVDGQVWQRSTEELRMAYPTALHPDDQQADPPQRS